jgi:hypothetical protein
MSIKRSIFEKILIESNDRSRQVDITSGSVQIDYYEDVFSPTITAKIRVINTGNTVTSPNSKDSQRQSIYNGLPLRGGERVAIKIAGNSSFNPGLDFLTDPKTYLYVSSITDVISETNKESFTLNLVSREAITNETVRVVKKYPTSLPIDQSVSKILSDVLKANKVGTIDKSSNKYGFIGNSRKPFTILTWLASKAVPEISGGGTAGFFFYQTVDGFQFRAIDNLSRQPVKASFYYSEALESYDVEGKKPDIANDFKILNYNTERNQNLIEKLRLGTYANYRIFFDPLTGRITKPGKIVFRQNDYAKKTNNLGKEEIKLPNVDDNSDLTLGDIPTRIITGILDVGTMDKGISKEINGDPTDYQSQTLLRYNFLFTQSLNVMVPSNTNLRAGDIIECFFPKISTASAKEYDNDVSGLYMIKELCHHFDATNSYTSLKLVRDTFGIR